MPDGTYDVRIWKKIEVYKGKRKTTHTVRWRVGTEEFREPHSTAAMADSFRSDLVTATNRGEAFNPATGRPISWNKKKVGPTWYAFVVKYMDDHWQGTSGNHRKDRARILTDATEALWTGESGKPDGQVLRLALQRWSFNTAHRDGARPDDMAAAIRWAEAHTVNIETLANPPVIRAVLKRVSTKKDGTAAAPTSAVKAKRVLSHALDYAVECGYLDANPISAVKWKTPKTSNQVDRYAVPNPRQVRSLISAVAQRRPSGPLLEAFFCVLYLAGLRPEEAVNLTWSDVTLPPMVWDDDSGVWVEPDEDDDWGEIRIREVAPDVGKRWTDSGHQRDRRQPKGRPVGEVRPVPCSPRLTKILRSHREQFGEGPDGLVFFGVRGRQLATCVYQDAWDAARAVALSEAQQRTSLAGRPYALRHACVSTWLNQSINPAQVAAWAGHSLDMLLKVYARCIDGHADADRRRAAKGFEGF